MRGVKRILDVVAHIWKWKLATPHWGAGASSSTAGSAMGKGDQSPSLDIASVTTAQLQSA